jgi:selenocysteine-specific elongation factor
VRQVNRQQLQLLVSAGHLVKVKEDLYFDRRAVEALRDRLTEFLRASGEISTPQFKDMTGVSRKYLIPLAEYFDGQNLTIRVGEVRKLRRSA